MGLCPIAAQTQKPIQENMQAKAVLLTAIDSSNQYIKTALLQTALPDSLEELSAFYALTANIAKEKGNYPEAFRFLALSKQIADSLAQAQTKLLTEALQKSKNKEITPKVAADNARELFLQKKLRNVFLFFLVVILVIAFILYRVNTLKDRANKRLREQNKAMRLQKEEIINSQKAIEKKNRMLELQNYEITLKNREIQLQNQDVRDSISYAQRIQAAMLPSDEKMQSILPEHFVLFKPKDIVSGDFYWLHAHQGNIIVAALDCTGHGVPGAFMSLIGKQLLDDIVIQQQIIQPALILDTLHSKIRTVLNQEETGNKDGMDMSICLINPSTHELIFAGAYNPIVVIQQKKFETYKGDNFPIGGWHFQGAQRAFSQQRINFEQGAMLYLYSDGYQDQFGGREERKFMKSRFRNLLMDIHQKSMSEQKRILNETIEDWKGIHPQVDDILVMGIKL